MKELTGICSSEETTEERLIALAVWMKKQYGSTMVQALKTVLPVREKVKAKEKRYIILNVSEEEAEKLQGSWRVDDVRQGQGLCGRFLRKRNSIIQKHPKNLV